MCVHLAEIDKFVSGGIINRGRWGDCDKLTSLPWQEPTAGKNDDSPAGIYVEIEANIGSGVTQMLLSINATIVAFEPQPSNLHRPLSWNWILVVSAIIECRSSILCWVVPRATP
jgi:hypothetical protein